MIRDGVSEGQFYQVLLYELDAIRKVGYGLFHLLPNRWISLHMAEPRIIFFFVLFFCLDGWRPVPLLSRITNLLWHLLWSKKGTTQDCLLAITRIGAALTRVETFYLVMSSFHKLLYLHLKMAFTLKENFCVSGTVVDSKICHPTEFDFYLCSHAGIQVI